MTDTTHKPFSEHFQEIADTTPDRYMLAWWRSQWEEVQKGYRGVSHGINSCRAEYGAFQEAIKEMQLQCEAMEKQAAETSVEVGRLRGRVTGLEASIEKARTAYSELRSKVQTNDKNKKEP